VIHNDLASRRQRVEAVDFRCTRGIQFGDRRFEFTATKSHWGLVSFPMDGAISA
jgi:hypothetical protein